jgi:hypothetical protein
MPILAVRAIRERQRQIEALVKSGAATRDNDTQGNVCGQTIPAAPDSAPLVKPYAAGLQLSPQSSK